MNHPNSEFERMLATHASPLPDSLRGDVARRIQVSLRHQTFRDDVRWLSLTFGILLVVVVGQWMVFRASHVQLKELSRTAIGSPESIGVARFAASTRTEKLD